MINFKQENTKYFKLVITIIISYLLIKIIDNTPFIFSILGKTYKILFPFIIAFIIAYILNPIVKLFEKRAKLSRSISIAITYLLFVGIIAIAFTFIIPKIYDNILDMVNQLPYITVEIQNWINNTVDHLKLQTEFAESLLNIDTNFVISKASSILMSALNGILSSAVSITGSVINFIFGFLISIYVLADKEHFKNFFKKILLIIFKEKKGTSIINILKLLNEMIGSYIGIKAIDSLIIGILALIGLTIIGSPYTALLASIIAITNMIPYFGPFIGMLVTFLVNVFTFPTKAIICLIFLFLLQQFDAWYLDPKLVGNKVGLSPFLVILAVTIGGALYGPLGMLLATPIMAVIKIYSLRSINKYESKQLEKNKVKTNNKD